MMNGYTLYKLVPLILILTNSISGLYRIIINIFNVIEAINSTQRETLNL